jgi:lysophospholipase L1-like esterase
MKFLNFSKFLIFYLVFFPSVCRAEKLVIYGMGDSITAGSNVDGLGTFLELNWVTGNLLNDSIAQKFKKEGISVHVGNVAKPGAVAADLIKQLSSIKDSKVDYFGITVGANDVCYWPHENYQPQIDLFINQLNSFLSDVERRFSTARVDFVPIPDLAHVKRMAGNSSYCSFVWRTAGVCKNILRENDASILDSYSALVHNLNQEIVNFLNLNNQDKFRLVNPEMANSFEMQHISKTDCFHPSIEGQRFISDILWGSF